MKLHEMKKLDTVKERNNYFEKNVKQQSQFNNQLAAYHQLQTQQMQKDMHLVNRDVGKDNDMIEEDECEYAVD